MKKQKTPKELKQSKEGRKMGRNQQKTQETNKVNNNMVELNSGISIITLNVHGLIYQIKGRDCQIV